MFPLRFWPESASVVVPHTASVSLCGNRPADPYNPHSNYPTHSASMSRSLQVPAGPLSLGLPSQLASFWRQVSASASPDALSAASHDALAMASFPVVPTHHSDVGDMSKSTAAQSLNELRHRYRGQMSAEYQLMLRQLFPVTCSPPPRSDSRTPAAAATYDGLNRKLNDDGRRSHENSPSPASDDLMHRFTGIPRDVKMPQCMCDKLSALKMTYICVKMRAIFATCICTMRNLK